MSADLLRRPRRSLRALLDRPGIVVAPGACDAITVRLIERAGFEAAYMTGSGVSLSASGIPDLGLPSLGEVCQRLEQSAQATALPLLADGDTGFGNPLNVVRAVTEFERRGAAAIRIEDQEMPKTCGHEPGRRLVPAGEMVARIEAARAARTSPEFLIVARTDARSTHGLAEAIARGRRRRRARGVAGERGGDEGDLRGHPRPGAGQHGRGRTHADPAAAGPRRDRLPRGDLSQLADPCPGARLAPPGPLPDVVPDCRGTLPSAPRRTWPTGHCRPAT